MCTHCIRNMKYTCTNHIFFENSNKTNKYFVIKIIIYDTEYEKTTITSKN